MSFGKPKKPPTQKTPASPFSTLEQTSYQSPFATGRSDLAPVVIGGKTYNELNTTTELTPQLQQSANTAQTGFGSGLDYLSQSPDQRFQSITSGNDLYYNVLADQLAQAQNMQLARAGMQGQSRGLQNSTTTGAAQAGILNDALRRERENQLASYNFGTQQATNQVGTNLGAMQGIQALSAPAAQMAAQQMMQGRQFGDQYAMQKAQADYQSAMAQYQQQQASAGWGSGIGSAIGAGLSLAAAPFTGGASLSYLPAAAALGGTVGSFGTGGTGGNSLGSAIGALSSYAPQQQAQGMVQAQPLNMGGWQGYSTPYTGNIPDAFLPKNTQMLGNGGFY